ncbi:phage integrase SAM-like domain-containing protein [Polynucleobacter necessarius]|uniref:phage integrase SAM-like domain-containing protein n=1 Tax=Polynucleobacter necessarius TaxID=576610 RepID=UPI001E2B8FCB|nr:phage integrase SAM-like domain-containing protein [Polynucleobacter necessarius]
MDHVVQISSNNSIQTSTLEARSVESDGYEIVKFHRIAFKALKREISKYAQGEITKQTLGMFKSRLNSRLIPCFGELEIGKIGYEQIADFVSYLHDHGIKPVTIKQYLGLLKRILTVALEAELIYKIPLFPKIKAKSIPRGEFYM